MFPHRPLLPAVAAALRMALARFSSAFSRRSRSSQGLESPDTRPRAPLVGQSVRAIDNC